MTFASFPLLSLYEKQTLTLYSSGKTSQKNDRHDDGLRAYYLLQAGKNNCTRRAQATKQTRQWHNYLFPEGRGRWASGGRTGHLGEARLSLPPEKNMPHVKRGGAGRRGRGLRQGREAGEEAWKKI